MSKMMRGLSRRDFLKGMAAGGAAVGSAGLLSACGSRQTVSQTLTGSEDTSGESTSEGSSESAQEETTSTEAYELDTSEQMNLVFYVMGDAPTDETVVEDALNEILLERLNATIDFQFSTWTDWTSKYNLTLTSNGADLIYAANWMDYGTFANSGAFMELDDLLDTVAPTLRDTVGEYYLDMMRVNGSIYGIPSTWSEYTCPGVRYREDLREAYDLPVPDSLENIETYLLGVQENLPDQVLMTAGSLDGFQISFAAASVFNIKYPWVTSNGLPYGLGADYDSPSDVYDYWFSDDFMEDMQLMKKWADLGFWSRSSLSEANNSDAFIDGLNVLEVEGLNPSKYVSSVSSFAEDHPDWSSGYIAYGEVTGVMYAGHATQNATAIVRGTGHEERALAVLELLMTDEEVNRLVQYGIEGVHYEVDEDGYYQGLSDDFGYEAFNTWNLRNADYRLYGESDDLLNELFEKYEEIGNQTKFPNVDIYSGFTEDYSSYSAERSAVANVMSQYLAPLQAGLVDDVEAAVTEFREKITEAGIETCRESFREQWKAYCEEYEYL